MRTKTNRIDRFAMWRDGWPRAAVQTCWRSLRVGDWRGAWGMAWRSLWLMFVAPFALPDLRELDGRRDDRGDRS